MSKNNKMYFISERKQLKVNAPKNDFTLNFP